MSRIRGAKIEEETQGLLQRKRLLESVREAETKVEPALKSVSRLLDRKQRGQPIGDITLVAAALHKQLCSQVHQLPGRPKAAQVSALLHDKSENWSIETCWTAARSVHRALLKQLAYVTKPNSPLHAETFRVAARDWVVLRATYESLIRLTDDERPP